MQKDYKESKTWFSLYSSKYLWITFSLFAYLQGKHLACTSPRNLVSIEQLCSSTAALPLAKSYGIFNERWWSGLCFYHHQWSPLAMCRGLAGLMSTERAYLNWHFDVPSSKYPIFNHLSKPPHSQGLEKLLMISLLTVWSLTVALFISRMGQLPWLRSHRAGHTRDPASKAMVVLRS